MTGKRSILVTGCSDGGLGSALAIALQKRGWRVIASARNITKLSIVKAAGIECVQLDVVSDESTAACVEEVKKLTGGSLDGIVNNAGMGYSMPLIHLDLKEMHDLFEINVFSLIRTTRAFLPLLIKSSQGAIVANVTSGMGLTNCVSPFQGAYASSKAAASMLTESMRLELSPFNIRAVDIVSGGVKSAFFDNALLPKLPDDSLYNAAKEEIEAGMAGKSPSGEGKQDTESWAKQVAGDLSQRKPPLKIYRGSMAGTARLASMAPTGMTDSMLKKGAHMDVFERKFQEQGGVKSLKLCA